MAATYTCVMFCITWVAYESVAGAEMKDVKDLKRKIFDGYDRQIRPVFDQRETINMNMTFNLISIDSLDLKSQKLKWNGWMSLKWHDQTLAWNSSHFGNIDFITLPQSMIWLPDLVLTNSITSSRSLGTPDTLVFLKSSGHVTWEPAVVTETSCKIDIRKYPFDQQKCTFAFLPWMTTTRGLNTTSVLDKIDLSAFVPHGEFEVIGSSVKVDRFPAAFLDDDLLGMTFTIILSRRPTFYWLIMIFPMMTFPLLCPISFLVPVECGEKITLSITVVLSFLVFIGSMSDAMPKLSDTVSLLVLYSSVQTTLSMLTVVANGIIICVSKLPRDFQFKTSVFALPSPMVLKGKATNIQTVFKSLGNVAMIGGDCYNEQDNKDVIDKNGLKSTRNDKWVLLARKMDKICFVLFMTFAVLVSIVFAFLMF